MIIARKPTSFGTKTENFGTVNGQNYDNSPFSGRKDTPVVKRNDNNNACSNDGRGRRSDGQQLSKNRKPAKERNAAANRNVIDGRGKNERLSKSRNVREKTIDNDDAKQCIKTITNIVISDKTKRRTKSND